MFRSLVLALVLALVALHAVEPLRVVATVPELGAIVRAIGGEDEAFEGGGIHAATLPDPGWRTRTG